MSQETLERREDGRGCGGSPDTATQIIRSLNSDSHMEVFKPSFYLCVVSEYKRPRMASTSR